MAQRTAPAHGDLSVILLHDKMVDKQGKLITSSLTMIDVHDIARSSRTFGVTNVFIAHPAPTLRKLALTLKNHWEEGFGATYNPNRKDAIELVQVVYDLDEAIQHIDLRTGKLPKLVATSAKPGGNRTRFEEFKTELAGSNDPYLLMLGTGWGMSEELLDRADIFLDPVNGPKDYNHLSVRSACAIMLDRLFGS
ncbi:MAG: hypothetical protein RL417_554 [Pseudomonadota bacterium]|jgi:hypothetical protein